MRCVCSRAIAIRRLTMTVRAGLMSAVILGQLALSPAFVSVPANVKTPCVPRASAKCPIVVPSRRPLHPPASIEVTGSREQWAQREQDHSQCRYDRPRRPWARLHSRGNTEVQSKVRLTALTASVLAVGMAVAALAPGTAAAAVGATTEAVSTGTGEEYLHVGQKIARFFQRGGLPDWATLMTISAMPVVELRGGVLVGIWMGLPIAKVFALCVAGNMIPIPVILLALKSQFVQKLFRPVLDRAREKAEVLGDAQSQALALTLFVGIPLPGTGAWTGAMGAFLLGMPFRKAMTSIFFGVISAGAIMTCLTLAGKVGALVATAALAVFCISKISSGGGKTNASDFSSQ